MSGWNKDDERQYLIEIFDQYDVCVEEFRVCGFSEMEAMRKDLANNRDEIIQIIKEAKGWRNKSPILRSKVTPIESY